MPHIQLGTDEADIVALFRYRPETAVPLIELVEVLLRGPSPLSPGQRELIATYVSSLNECGICTSAHAALAAARLPGGRAVTDQVCIDPAEAPVSDKLKALLQVAGVVQISGGAVRPDDVEAARAAGATDAEIHDTVLVAAAICMTNRYVDGLAAPKDPALYDKAVAVLLEDGYRGLLNGGSRERREDADPAD